MAQLDCSFCGRTFQKPEHVRRHERSHTGSRPYVCTKCGRAFARKDALTRHNRVHGVHNQNGTITITLPPSPISNKTVSSPDSSNHPTDRSDQHAETIYEVGSVRRASEIKTPSATVNPYASYDPTDTIAGSLIWPDAEELFQSLLAAPVDFSQGHTFANEYSPSFSHTSTRERFGDQAASIADIPHNSSLRVVSNVNRMVARISADAANLTFGNLSSRFLDQCLHMFFVKFIPVFPILHRPTFVFQECLQPLLLSAMAIGSLYLGQTDAVSLGQQLWKLTFKAITSLSQDMILHQGPDDIKPGAQLLLASFLTQLYGAMSSDQGIREESQTMASSSFAWARRCGIMMPSSHEEQYSLPSLEEASETKERAWRRWVAQAVQRRALLSHYILDGLLIRMTGLLPCERHRANKLFLEADSSAFAAESADDFILAMQLSSRQNHRLSFQAVFQQVLSDQPQCPMFDLESCPLNLLVILEGLQAVISDKRQEADLDRIKIGRSLLMLFHTFDAAVFQSRAEKLETKLLWHAICLELIVDTVDLGRYLCRRHSIRETIWSKDSTPSNTDDFANWSQSCDARRALLHAIQMQTIIEDLPRGRAHALQFPSALMSASTVCAAFCLAGTSTVNLPRDPHWDEVVAPRLHEGALNLDDAHQATRSFIKGEFDSGRAIFGAYRNLMYECNSLQKLFGCLATQWGVASAMGNVLRQWTARINSPIDVDSA